NYPSLRMSSDELRVAELRSLISAHLTPYYDTHFNLLRWLQGQPGLSIEKVAYRLRHHLLFRASSWDVDSVHQKQRGYHPVHKYWSGSRCGPSDVIPNCIVHVEHSGKIDFDGILDNYSITEVMKARIYDTEEMLADVMQMEKETGLQSFVIYVMDVDGLEYSKKLIDLVLGPLRSLSEFMADHYAELIKFFVIVNAPSWMYTLWTMIKPLLPERTRQKVRIPSTSNWREEIHCIMDPSICPVFWNDENHSEFGFPMERPPKVPRLEITEPADNLGKVCVKAGQVYWMEYSLQKGDAISFYVKGNGNIGFTIVRVENEEEDDAFAMRQIFPLFPWMPDTRVPIEDTVIVPETGVYRVWFSNSRAWWSSLTIQHNIKVIKSQLTD
ncbi:hypothetical protein PENTCL1PPCAC_29130, partial [Pristionchus entomophagus]